MTVASYDSSIWATGQVQPRRQRDGLYSDEGTAHPAKMWPAIAAAMIERYSSPGETVFDPMCGIGTVPVEAIRLGRNAIGADCENEWVHVARANIARARKAHPGPFGEVFCADATKLRGKLSGRKVAFPVDLVVTSPPYGPVVHGRLLTARETGGKIVRRSHRYSSGKPHPGQLSRGSSQRRMRSGLVAVFDGCRAALREGGHLVVTARPYTSNGAVVDFPGTVIAAAEEAGFAFIDRHVALLARWDGEMLHPHVTFFHLGYVRGAVGSGRHAFVRAHEDVLVFRRSA